MEKSLTRAAEEAVREERQAEAMAEKRMVRIGMRGEKGKRQRYRGYPSFFLSFFLCAGGRNPKKDRNRGRNPKKYRHRGRNPNRTDTGAETLKRQIQVQKP